MHISGAAVKFVMKNSLFRINGILELNLRFMHRQGCITEPFIKAGVFFIPSNFWWEKLCNYFASSHLCMCQIWMWFNWTENSFYSLYWKEQYCTKADQRWVSNNSDIFQTGFAYLWNNVFQVWNSCHQWKCSVTSRHRTVTGFSFS